MSKQHFSCLKIKEQWGVQKEGARKSTSEARRGFLPLCSSAQNIPSSVGNSISVLFGRSVLAFVVLVASARGAAVGSSSVELTVEVAVGSGADRIDKTLHVGSWAMDVSE